MSQDSATVVDHDEYDYPDRFDRHPLVRVATSRWKHAVVTVVLAATTWTLYSVAGGWSLDATVFALATVGLVAYSALTLRTDLE